MPYIKDEYRKLLDDGVSEVVTALKLIKDDNLDGCMNYVVTRMLYLLYGGGGYAVYNRAMGVLDCVSREFYRRVVAPYEDKKISENGDVYK